MSVLNGLFNVTDTTVWGAGNVLVPDGSTDNSPNLQNMIKSLLDPTGITLGQGGTLEFPSAGDPSGGSTYAFSSTITIGPVGAHFYPANIILRGTGAQDRGSPILQMTDNTQDFFLINNHSDATDPPGNDNIAGVVFQDMIISFVNAVGSGGGRGIVAAHGNVRLQRITLDEVPDAAVHFIRTLHCSIIDSDIRVEQVSGGTGVRLGDPDAEHSAIETYIAGTTIAAYNTGGKGMEIYGAEHLRVVNCRLEGWTNSIVIEPGNTTDGVRKLYFGNVSCFSSEVALQIIPSGGSSETKTVYVTQVWFAQCEFGPGNMVGDDNPAGIVVGPVDGYNIIDTVRFVDCFSCQWPGPGLQIDGGTSIEVLGGHYSCNGNNDGGEPAVTGGKSGIAITAAAVEVRISNVACNNTVFDIHSHAYASPTQNYGIYVSNGAESVRINGCALVGNEEYGLWVDATSTAPSNVFVKDCDLTGNTLGPVQVSGTVDNLQVVDCPGYNDSQTAALTTSPPPTTAVFHASDHGYYGPATFCIAVNTMVTAVKINGVATGLKVGAFFLGAGQSGEIDYSGLVPPGFVMLGQ
jgi:hypothetical protein